MNKKTILIMVGAILFLGAGCGQTAVSPQNVGKTQIPSQAQPDSVATQNAQAGSAITINNFAFSPGTLTVKTGTTVTWTNNDAAGHQVVADATDLPDFKSDVFYAGQTYSFTFNKAGTFNYHCQIHPSMKGIIIVQ
jgi:plastocyanin